MSDTTHSPNDGLVDLDVVRPFHADYLELQERDENPISSHWGSPGIVPDLRVRPEKSAR